MMYHTFEEVETYLRKERIVKRIALCGAHDEPALSALVEARRGKVATGLLIGDTEMIRNILYSMGEPVGDYELIHEPDETAAAALAIAAVKEGRADIPMKGLMQTSSYMRAILNKETGILPQGKLLSECTVFEYAAQGRLLFASDCAVNIEPGREEKVQIIRNAVDLACRFGVETPKVAVLSALEKVNSKIKSTIEADELAQRPWDGCVVEGPLALDNAVSEEAARHKGIASRVAGRADVLVMPDLCAGNILHKALNYFAGVKTAGALCGTEYPVIMTSRTDTPDTKYNSILTAILQSL